MDNVVNIDVRADFVKLLKKRVSRIQLTYDNGSCLYKFTVTSLHVNHSGMILGWVKQVGCMQRFPVIRLSPSP